MSHPHWVVGHSCNEARLGPWSWEDLMVLRLQSESSDWNSVPSSMLICASKRLNSGAVSKEHVRNVRDMAPLIQERMIGQVAMMSGFFMFNLLKTDEFCASKCCSRVANISKWPEGLHFGGNHTAGTCRNPSLAHLGERNRDFDAWDDKVWACIEILQGRFLPSGGTLKVFELTQLDYFQLHGVCNDWSYDIPGLHATLHMFDTILASICDSHLVSDKVTINSSAVTAPWLRELAKRAPPSRSPKGKQQTQQTSLHSEVLPDLGGCQRWWDRSVLRILSHFVNSKPWECTTNKDRIWVM